MWKMTLQVTEDFLKLVLLNWESITIFLGVWMEEKGRFWKPGFDPFHAVRPEWPWVPAWVWPHLWPYEQVGTHHYCLSYQPDSVLSGCVLTQTSPQMNRKRRRGLFHRYNSDAQLVLKGVNCSFRFSSFKTHWMTWLTGSTRSRRKTSSWSQKTQCWASTSRTSCRLARCSRLLVPSQEGE